MADSQVGRPNFSGTWRSDLRKSTIRGPLPAQMEHRIEHGETAIDHELVVTSECGAEHSARFRYLTGAGETVNVLAGQAVTTKACWDGPELVVESWLEMPSRQLHFIDRWSLSEDGNTLTMAHREGDLTGQVVINHREP